MRFIIICSLFLLTACLDQGSLSGVSQEDGPNLPPDERCNETLTCNEDDPSPDIDDDQDEPSPVISLEPRNSANLFTSGHSLLDPVASVIGSVGLAEFRLGAYYHHTIPGSPIESRLQSLGDEIFGMNNYDTLIVTERHDLIPVLRWHLGHQDFKDYVDRFLNRNPNAQEFFYYHSWLEIDYNNPLPWIEHETAAGPVWECTALKVSQMYTDEMSDVEIQNIPASTALVELVSRSTGGNNLPGVTQANDYQTIDYLFSDNVHVEDVTSYFLTLVTYAFVMRRSLDDIDVPIGISTLTAQSLKTVAWDVVTNYAPEFTSLAQCRDYMEDYCSVAATFLRLPGNNPLTDVNTCLWVRDNIFND